MPHHMIFATETRTAELAIETRRDANALVAHVSLQMTFAQVTLATNGAGETLMRIIVAIMLHIAAKNAVPKVKLGVYVVVCLLLILVFFLCCYCCMIVDYYVMICELW